MNRRNIEICFYFFSFHQRKNCNMHFLCSQRFFVLPKKPNLMRMWQLYQFYLFIWVALQCLLQSWLVSNKQTFFFVAYEPWQQICTSFTADKVYEGRIYTSLNAVRYMLLAHEIPKRCICTSLVAGMQIDWVQVGAHQGRMYASLAVEKFRLAPKQLKGT